MPPPARRRTSTPRGERTRTAIMNAAIPLFARHGYRGAPLAAVADAVEMTQPGLLHHFPTKEHLLMAVLRERDRDGIRRLREGWYDSGRSAMHNLETLVEYNSTTPDLVQMFTVLVAEAVSAEHPAHEFFVERYAAMRQRAREAVERAQESGEFRADVDAERIATLILAVMDGLQLQWLLDGGRDMPPSFALFVDMLLEYLTPGP